MKEIKANPSLTPLTPMELINNAINKGLPAETLQQIFNLKKDYESDEARKSFYRAKSEFQNKSLPVIKTKKGAVTKSGKVAYKYAPLEVVAISIANALKSCNLTYRFDQRINGDMMTVICIISHIQGYEERTEVSVPISTINTGGFTNSVQNSMIIQSYAKRYSLVNALGIIIADEDTDAHLEIQPSKLLSAEQKITLNKLMLNTKTSVDTFNEVFCKNGIDNLLASNYRTVFIQLNSKLKSQQKLLGESTNG